MIDGATLAFIVGANAPVYLALAGLYYKNGQTDARVQMIQNCMVMRVKLKK